MCKEQMSMESAMRKKEMEAEKLHVANNPSGNR